MNNSPLSNSHSMNLLVQRFHRFRYPILILALGLVLLTGRGFAQDERGTATEAATETAATVVEDVPATIETPTLEATMPKVTPTAEVTSASNEVTPIPVVTPTVIAIEPTATPLATETPIPTVTTISTVQATTVRSDRYEPDSQAAPIPYTGMQLRSFHSADDADYVVYRVKANVQTWLRTTNLRGSADTVLTAYHLHQGHLLGSNDDDGNGFSSQLNLNLTEDTDLLIVIENKAMGYGDNVTYQFEIITEIEQPPTAAPTTPATVYPTYTPLPTYTPFPSSTPTPQPTWTPYPTYTPIPWPTATKQTWPTVTPLPTGPWYTPTPTRVWPTATPRPAQQVAIVPQATATTVPCLIRVEVFQDRDGDDTFEPGEGIHAVYIEASTFMSDWTTSGYTNNGVLTIDTHGGVGEEIEIRLPYLHQTAHVETVEGVVTVTILLPAPKLPIALP